jgi:hypothetical protein
MEIYFDLALFTRERNYCDVFSCIYIYRKIRFSNRYMIEDYKKVRMNRDKFELTIYSHLQIGRVIIQFYETRIILIDNNLKTKFKTYFIESCQVTNFAFILDFQNNNIQ